MSDEDSSNIEEAMEAIEGKGNDEPILMDVTLPSDTDSDKTVVVQDEKPDIALDSDDEEMAQKSEQSATESEQKDVTSEKKDNPKKLANLKIGNVEGNVVGEGHVGSTDDESDLSPNISPTKAYFKQPGNTELFEGPDEISESTKDSSEDVLENPFSVGQSDDSESLTDGATHAASSNLDTYAEPYDPNRREREGSTSSNQDHKRLASLGEDITQQSSVFEMSTTIEFDPFPSRADEEDEEDAVVVEEAASISDQSPNKTTRAISNPERSLPDHLNLEFKDKDVKKSRKRSSDSVSETKSCKF